MAVQSSEDERVISDTQVNRSVLLNQTGLLRLTWFCHALFCFGCIKWASLTFDLDWPLKAQVA